jgi:dolichyl-diphosphooligosaccharide--protein glycosyltransferase
MQFTAVFLKNYIVGDKMSLNDICCYMPAWFGVLASFLVGCIAYEASLETNSMSLFSVVLDALMGRYTEVGEKPAEKPTGYYKLSSYLGLRSPAVECAVFAMGFMAVVPAHLMRSVGGGYDNESVAVSAMCLTFYFWMRSLRSGEKYSYLIGIVAGVAYFYMVAAWGGYIFVLNLIGAHAALLVLLGRFSNKVYLAYTLFYIVGTSLAIQVPVVGWAPLKSLEQLGPCAVFLGYQILQYCEMLRKKNKWNRAEAWKFRIKFGVVALIGLVIFVMAVTPKGYFGPMSSRVRGLFVPHTKTGNPLVDSVAEHQAASQQAYWQYLHIMCFLAPMGFVFMMFRFGDSASFLFVYAFSAYFFSHKMVRLILLTAPIASSLSGIAVGRLVSWSLSTFLEDEVAEDATTEELTADKKSKEKENGKGKASKKKESKPSGETNFAGIAAIQDGFIQASKSTEGKIVKGIASIVILGSLYYQATTFKTYAWGISKGLSNPSIIVKGQLRDGQVVYVDDYREAYWWLRDNTPEDSRIMAWWDYGYQITGIANRTTIADGNTWNHEHIALLGKALTGTEEEGYQIARHLADYVLVWGGGGGDDLAKSPHLARIANSVYRDHCPGDVTCRAFGFVVSSSIYALARQLSLHCRTSHNLYVSSCRIARAHHLP